MHGLLAFVGLGVTGIVISAIVLNFAPPQLEDDPRADLDSFTAGQCSVGVGPTPEHYCLFSRYLTGSDAPCTEWCETNVDCRCGTTLTLAGEVIANMTQSWQTLLTLQRETHVRVRIDGAANDAFANGKRLTNAELSMYGLDTATICSPLTCHRFECVPDHSSCCDREFSGATGGNQPCGASCTTTRDVPFWCMVDTRSNANVVWGGSRDEIEAWWAGRADEVNILATILMYVAIGTSSLYTIVVAVVCLIKRRTFSSASSPAETSPQ